MGAIPVIFGKAMRATAIDRCGKPIQGSANRIVTNAFISVTLSPEVTAAEEKTQKNAEGKDCFKKRTPPEFQRHNIDMKMCGADPDMYSLIAGYERILDYDDTPIGFADGAEVSSARGVAIEVWSDAMTDESCPLPESDAIFSLEGTGEEYGYWLFFGTEWIPSGDYSISENPSELGFSGITIPGPYWHRGPYNVARIDGNNTPGRLLTPVGKKRHVTFFKTPIAPPEETGGLVPLAVQSVFVDPDFYVRGPANEPAADVAPDQPAANEGVELTITGTPTGGTFSLAVEYLDGPADETGTIVYNATAANVKTALVAVDDDYTAADWTVTGTDLPGGTVTIVPPAGVVVTVGDNNLTGGTTPTVHIDPA